MHTFAVLLTRDESDFKSFYDFIFPSAFLKAYIWEDLTVFAFEVLDFFPAET